LKDQLAQEVQKREHVTIEFQRSQSQVFDKMRQLEQDMLARVKEQRES